MKPSNAIVSLGIVALCALTASSALAAVREEQAAPMSTVAAWDSPFESGGTGCYDPVAWVWSAPRAERVLVDVPVGTPCEIGTLGCDRVAESTNDEGGFTALVLDDSAESICGMKSKQHSAGEGEEPFDATSCLESERAPIAESLPVLRPAPAPVRPRGPACTELGDECRSLPPSAPITTPEIVRAAPVMAPSLPEPRLHAGIELARGLRALLGPATGVSARVYRPPAGA